VTAGDRTYAERTPEGAAPSFAEEPSASEAAAAAVIERLESILSEPTVDAGRGSDAAYRSGQRPVRAAGAKLGQAETPPPRETRNELPPITFLEVKSAGRSWLGAFTLVILGAIGVGLLALAAILGLPAEGDRRARPGAAHRP
jgi:hypothetical protein